MHLSLTGRDCTTTFAVFAHCIKAIGLGVIDTLQGFNVLQDIPAFEDSSASEGQAEDFHPSNEVQPLELSEDSDDSLGIQLPPTRQRKPSAKAQAALQVKYMVYFCSSMYFGKYSDKLPSACLHRQQCVATG